MNLPTIGQQSKKRPSIINPKNNKTQSKESFEKLLN